MSYTPCMQRLVESDIDDIGACIVQMKLVTVLLRFFFNPQETRETFTDTYTGICKGLITVVSTAFYPADIRPPQPPIERGLSQIGACAYEILHTGSV